MNDRSPNEQALKFLPGATEQPTALGILRICHPSCIGKKLARYWSQVGSASCNMPGSISIRDAVPNEAASLSALALRSKAHWGYSREFIQSCENELTYEPSQLESSKSYFAVAQRGSDIVGFYSLEVLSARQFELVALFVEPKHIGTGVGRDLMRHALNAVAVRSGESLLIQGDPNAEKFYIAAGARRIGARESGSIPGRFLPLFEIPVRMEEGDVA